LCSINDLSTEDEARRGPLFAALRKEEIEDVCETRSRRTHCAGFGCLVFLREFGFFAGFGPAGRNGVRV
jgi:hypothetical protein